LVRFEPGARARLSRAPTPTLPSATDGRRDALWLRSAFAGSAPRARARVQPVAVVVSPPATAIDAPSVLAPSPPRKPRLMSQRWVNEPCLTNRIRPRVVFDYYVVHSWSDDPTLKASALKRWAAGYARAHDGRRPCIWLDTLCADATRTEAEQLADLPFVMGRARGLLLLCGPKTLDRLRCAIELYVWLATGGSVDDVQIALLGPPDVYPQLVAAFDVYHAMYASTAADASDPAVVEQLMRVVELARVSVFNEKVRSFLPVVREHAARAGAQTEAALPASLSRIDSQGAPWLKQLVVASKSLSRSANNMVMNVFRASSSAFRASTRGSRARVVSREASEARLASGSEARIASGRHSLRSSTGTNQELQFVAP
jgi:hypothetical protein